MKKYVSVGYDNFISEEEIICIINNLTGEALGIIEKAKEDGKLIDTTDNKKVKSIVLTKAGYVVLSARSASSISKKKP